jgi:hypothetical protein
MAIGKQLSDGNPDGTSLGQGATDKVSLYNVTPVVQASLPAAVSTSTPVAGSTGFSFGTSTQMTGLIATVNTMRTILQNLGIAV